MVRFTIFIVAILACNTFAINFPHQVSVRYHRFKFHFCNGAILTDYWVLTSARCVYQLPPDGLYVRYGESDASTITTNRIKERVFHPKFKYFTQKNNLAMLLTIEKIVFIPGVVVPVGLQMRPVDDGETVFISGWKWNRESQNGVLHEELTNISSTILPFDDCKGTNEEISLLVHEGQSICTKDSFNFGGKGDAGNPLVSRTNHLVAVASYFGGSEGHPDVYTLISPYIHDWINIVVQRI